jgi:hypothetical protein
MVAEDFRRRPRNIYLRGEAKHRSITVEMAAAKSPDDRNLRYRHLMYWEGGRWWILPNAADVRFRKVGLGESRAGGGLDSGSTTRSEWAGERGAWLNTAAG